jgi:hypothetical protein
MGFWSGLFNVVGAVFDGVLQVGNAIVNAVPPVVEAAIKAAKRVVDEIVKVGTEAFRKDPNTAREYIERDLQEVNARIQRLRQKYQEKGSLNQADRESWEYLKQQRNDLNSKLTALDQINTAEDIVKQEKDYEATTVSDDNAQILQYHVGQSTHNKICTCGRPMVLQWNRELSTAGLKDFFWGCSGWYIVNNGKRICARQVRLSQEDLILFANLNRDEFKLKSAELTRKTLDPKRAKRVRDALDSIRAEHRKRRLGIAIYRCPIHGESLRLQRKKQTTNGLLDEYFLGCPRWLPNNAGCDFKVKLKSAAQISSVLVAEHDQGVFETAGS